MFKRFASFILLMTLLSCAGLKSGRYITLNRDYEPAEIAKLFKVPEWKLNEINKGRTFKKGSTVFLPLTIGILSKKLNSRNIASFDYKSLDTSGRFMWPVPSSKKVSSNFGPRWGRKHEGMDIAARRGAKIVATDSGVVVYADNELGGYGNIIVLAHKDGFFSVYAHNDKNYVSKGQKIHKGQVIGSVGSTGRSTGNHLHFEIRRDSVAYDPRDFFKQYITQN